MSFASIKMLVEHTGKTPNTVRAALKASGVKLERPPGVQGFRIPLAAANRFLSKHWPEKGPLSEIPKQ